MKELFSDAVKNFGKNRIVMEILGELRRAESGDKGYAIGSIRELYALLKEKLILPWERKPEGPHEIIKPTLSARHGFNFLKHDNGKIIMIEVRGGMAKKPNEVGDVADLLAEQLRGEYEGKEWFKVLSERLDKLMEEGRKAKVGLKLVEVYDVKLGDKRVRIYVYEVKELPEELKGTIFEVKRYWLLLEELPEEVEVVKRVELRAVIEVPSEGVIKIKPETIIPAKEESKLVWGEETVKSFLVCSLTTLFPS